MTFSSFSLCLIHLWIGFVSCAVYHIVPSPDHHCPVESCLTLSSFAANASLYLDSNTTLIFQPGNHSVYSELHVTNITRFSMASYITKESNAGIICGENSSKSDFSFEAIDSIYISSLNFFGCKCKNIEFVPNILSITVILSNSAFLKCVFEGHRSTSVISAIHSNITLAQCTFKDNLHDLYYSDGLFLSSYSNVMIVNSTFITNDGKLMYIAIHGHDVVPTIETDSSLTIAGCEYRNNYNDIDALIDVKDSEVSIMDTKFIYNREKGCLYAVTSAVTIERCAFENNDGLVIKLIQCTVDIFNSMFDCNQAVESFSDGGALSLRSSVIRIHGSEFKNNVAQHRGGAIYCSDNSWISFSKICTLASNHAEQGGAVHLDESVQCFIAYGATLIIANNTASTDGGGIYLSHTRLILHSHSTLQILENRATVSGGGIYASESSSISLYSNNNGQTSNPMICFHKNQASKGGGLFLGYNSTVRTYACLNNNIVKFDENSAKYGGAVYTFSNLSTIPYPECFFQSFPHPILTPMYNSTYIECNKQNEFPFQFLYNRANHFGVSFFKSNFENCSINGKAFEEFTVLKSLSNVQTSDIGSFLVELCYCENGNPDRTKQIPFIDIKTAEKVTIDVAIVDRGNHIVNGSVVSDIRGSVLIRDNQKIQDVINGCTSLVFNIIFSLETPQQLILSPQLKRDSIYITKEGSKRRVKLNFLACIECPIGFQQIKRDARGCDCVCDEAKLGPYIVTCNYTRETITKKGTTAWIGYLSRNDTNGYLIYPYCPMDYCFPPDATVEINLNLPNGADAQCSHNRSGLLCGTCILGLSLSLGSSRCLPCLTYWPGLLAAIIIGTFLAGIVIVASLLMLDLTVATGTLNGLIFYANIVAANQHKFFPSTSFISVFVSWFNLELGIDTCFFDGMDFYWKTWIQLAFPAYILLLVVLVIVVSEHSVKFAEIVAKKNPLATLNTLILLSYVKLLRTIILAFSFATLDCPNFHSVVWWPDASVGYFSGKHIVLWVVAALILVAGIFYTAILFSWQWCLYYQHKMIFKWIARNQRLCMFVEPNHAPYAFKHRYWAGLLLLVRVIVYTISTADVSSDRTITLLAIGIITFFLTILICRFQPYRIWLAEALEVFCHVNIVCLCFATFYVSKVGKSQDVIAYVSGTISFTLFLIVLGYHAITQLFFATRLGKKLKNKLAQQFSNTATEEQVNLVVQHNEPVTYSVVDPPTREEELPQSPPDIPRSKRNTTNNVSESAGFEENELKPIEQKVADSSTPYVLMK